jgi:hypothetical protein
MLIECPHCNQLIEIIEMNCRIFRCGVFKNNFNQINPHAPKDECDDYIKNDLIYGCGKPFIMVLNTAVICDYNDQIIQ